MSKFGIALGGGGTKGAYHIGVWQALKKMNIEISAIVGTSIGSVNGALISQGDFHIAEKIWNSILVSNVIEVSELGNGGDNVFEPKNILNVIFAIYKNNGMETGPFKKMLERVVDEEKIRNSSIGFGLVTYSVDELEGKELFIEDIPKGKLVEFLMASASMPGLKSTVIDEKKYIDGGVSNNVPASMLLKKGITDIIAVDVGGMGIVKGIENVGVNVINIKCSENLIGHLEFNETSITNMIKMGYYDTFRAFERLKGKIYNFNVSDYHNMRTMYSNELIYGIEKAAQIFGIDKFKVYKFEDLKDAVIKTFLQNSKKYRQNVSKSFKLDGLKLDEKQMLIKFTDNAINKNLDTMSNKILHGLLGDIYSAANSIVYFLNS